MIEERVSELEKKVNKLEEQVKELTELVKGNDAIDKKVDNRKPFNSYMWEKINKRDSKEISEFLEKYKLPEWI